MFDCITKVFKVYLFVMKGIVFNNQTRRNQNETYQGIIIFNANGLVVSPGLTYW